MLSLVAGLLLSHDARAYSTVGAAWSADGLPVPYFVASPLGGGLDDDAALTAIQAGFQAWQDAGCGVSFAYQGRQDSATFGGAADGQNVVFIIDSGWPEDSALVSTPAIFTSATDLVEVDFALNAQTYAWVTEGADGVNLMDVQGRVTHEVGHMLGLWHSDVTGASLNPALAGSPEARSLEDDDLEGLCALYEAVASGEGSFGEACEETPDCADGLVCLADGDDRYCSQTCAGDEECPEGYSCFEVPGSDSTCALSEKTGCGCTAAPRGGLLGALLPLGAALLRRRRPRAG